MSDTLLKYWHFKIVYVFILIHSFLPFPTMPLKTVKRHTFYNHNTHNVDEVQQLSKAPQLLLYGLFCTWSWHLPQTSRGKQERYNFCFWICIMLLLLNINKIHKLCTQIIENPVLLLHVFYSFFIIRQNQTKKGSYLLTI